MKKFFVNFGRALAIPVVLFFALLSIQRIKATGSRPNEIAVLDVVAYMKQHYLSKIMLSSLCFWSVYVAVIVATIWK